MSVLICTNFGADAAAIKSFTFVTYKTITMTHIFTLSADDAKILEGLAW